MAQKPGNSLLKEPKNRSKRKQPTISSERFQPVSDPSSSPELLTTDNTTTRLLLRETRIENQPRQHLHTNDRHSHNSEESSRGVQRNGESVLQISSRRCLFFQA